MQPDKMVVVDLIRKKEEHYVFNSLTLNALSSLVKRIDCYLSDDSTLLDDIPGNASVNKIKVTRTKFYFWVTSTYNTIKLLLKNRCRKNRIIFLSVTPLHYFILSAASVFLRGNYYLFMHGELGYLQNATGLGQKLGSIFINMAFKFGSVNFICINAPIHDVLKKIYPQRNFLHIEHPIQNISTKNCKEHSNLVFGTFGILSRDKGSERIYDLAALLEKKSIRNITLMTVGVTDGSFEYDQSPDVIHHCKGVLRTSLIPRTIFFENVRKIDVVLLFNSTIASAQKYELISSGVFADCIAFSTPIIALRNKKLDSYFKLYGEFGILCNSLDEMALALSNINSHPEILNAYKNVLKKIQQHLRPEGYAELIREKIMYEKG